MPRSANPKCIHCATLSVEEAIALHGETGDGCWNPKICHRRRSHYRHRKDVNAKRRQEYHSSIQTDPRGVQRGMHELDNPVQRQPGVPAADVAPYVPSAMPLLPPYAAYLYLYKESRKDAVLHAIAITLWQGNEKRQTVLAEHCGGQTAPQIQKRLRDVLQYLREHYGISRFEPEIILSPQECPLHHCPLKNLSDVINSP